MSNPAKLRALSKRVGQPVIRAYARWFDEQTTLIAFTSEREAWIVPRVGDVERYTEPIQLLETGIRTGGLT